MYLVFGIDNYEGVLEYEALWDADLSVTDAEPFTASCVKNFFYHQHQNTWASAEDALYRNWQWGGEIIGLSLAYTRYDSPIVRALSVMDTRFSTANKYDIPVWDRSDPSVVSYKRRIEDAEYQCGDIPWLWQWFYPATIEYHGMWPVHAYLTRHLFRRVGIDIDYNRYKAMLVWEWV